MLTTMTTMPPEVQRWFDALMGTLRQFRNFRTDTTGRIEFWGRIESREAAAR